MDDDPNLWLEEAEGQAALDWVQAQNAATLKDLESDPRFEPLKLSIELTLTTVDRIPLGSCDGLHVYNFWQDKKQLRGVIRRTSMQSYKSDSPDWETVLDVDELAEEEGENWVYKDWNVLEPTRDRALVVLSRGGQDASVVRELDLVKKTFVEGGFQLNEAKSYVQWLDKDRLLVGTDFGAGSLTDSGYPRGVKVWHRGTSIADAEMLFEGTASDVGVHPLTSIRDNRVDVFVLQNISFFETEFYWQRSDQKLVKLPLPLSSTIGGVFNGMLLLHLKQDWDVDSDTFPQGAIVTFDLPFFGRTGRQRVEPLYIPGKAVTVENLVVTRDYVYVMILEDVRNRLVALWREREGWCQGPMPLPEAGCLTIHSASSHHNSIMVGYENFLTPVSLYLIDEGRDVEGPVKSLAPQFDGSGLSMEQHFATSKDGTRIPYFLVCSKNLLLDGTTPTLQYGYGGYEISLKPTHLSATIMQWVNSGGAFVVANIRGGGEYGPGWHRAAQKMNRHLAFEDFVAVSHDLISKGITSPSNLGIQGGSNGGLLMGVMLTQHPELYGAIICQAPLLDMLRFDKLLAGVSWIAEFGDPDHDAEGDYLKSYSPYHRVSKKVRYPRVFFMASTLDDRVHPGHARKMVARMQEQGHSVLYYENCEGGHSGAANQLQQAHNGALQVTYLLKELS